MNTTATPNALPQAPDHPERRTWLLITGSAAGVAAVGTAVPLVSTLAPSERAKALGAAVEVSLADIPPGGTKTVEWRGKPVWVQRRTPEMLAALQGHDAVLADPLSARDALPEALRNPGRSARPDIFVAIGICTHLGCSPSAVAKDSGNASVPADWPGGFFCPCHGSLFDLSGRVFKNMPAPTNLEIPPHRFVDAEHLVIGESDAA
jgi:ubiquinol-cytochrome c reductase iron-sulfur subunit